MEGYVLRWTNFIKGWRPRYIALENCYFYISKHKTDKKKKIIDAAVVKLIEDRKKKQFTLVVGEKVIYFKTNTDDEKFAWIQKLNDAHSLIEKKIINLNNSNRYTIPGTTSTNLFNSYQTLNSNASISHFEKLPTEENTDIDININEPINTGIGRPKSLKINKFSENFQDNYKEINKKDINNLDKYSIVINDFQNLQNLFHEFNFSLENFNFILMEKKKLKHNDLTKIYENLFNLKQHMKEQMDLTLKSVVEYKEENDNLNGLSPLGTKKFIQDIETNFNTKPIIQEIPKDESDLNLIRNRNGTFYISAKDEIELDEENDNESSFEDCLGAEDENLTELEKTMKSSIEESILKDSSEKKEKFARSLSKCFSDFFDANYTFKERKALPSPVKTSNSMISDMLKSLTKDKITLPIHYNEPISMLQRQCEKFLYSYLLSQANSCENGSQRMVYIAAFIVAEMSLNINRILKPYNPVLGETFEYIDNNLHYRYFSEQVSHVPPISAYICESEDYAVYGDTRCKNKFKILKGALELIFSNKTSIIFKNSNEHYAYNKPTVYLKGLIMGSPHYDFSGIVNIENVNDKSVKAFIDFFEEGRKSKPLGYFEGKIMENNKVVNLIKGNWNSNLIFTDKDGKEPVEIWKIVDDAYHKNTDLINNYLIPSFSCNLNYLPTAEEANLKNVLPYSDSRFRPDQRLYETRQMELAEKEKNRIEQKQRDRHKMFEEEKIKYEPYYFSDVLDPKVGEYVYIYKGGYWEDRKKKSYNHLNNIFL